MRRVVGPRAGFPPELALPFGLIVACWAPVAGLGAVWTGGYAASWVSGHGWTGPAFGWQFAGRLMDGGPAAVWPGTPAVLVWMVTGLIVIVPTLGGVVVVLRSGRKARTPSLASARELHELSPRSVAARATRLRAGLAGGRPRHLPPSDTGVALGRLASATGARAVLRASWEDVLLAVMAPRTGKTTALSVPTILDAPGAVVATSNKSDLWAATAQLRERRTGGRVWVFDPQQIAHAERTWWWNPLRGVTSVEEAHRLASHFIQEVRGERGDRDFWSAAAHDLLTGLLLAAALNGRSLVEVYEWLNDPALTTPVELLRRREEIAVAASLLGRSIGAPETRDGVYETARTAAQCLRDRHIMAWVTPITAPLPELDAAEFAASRDTLYLLSKEGAGAAAPLVAALTDRVMREATRLAERRGGRLDPPLVVVLDEAANVCRIADLPDLYSHFGSRGITPLTILQSYRQGSRVWGENGMDALWSAATIKLIGPGLDDARFAEDLSRLVGEHDATIRTVSYGDRRRSDSLTVRRQRILGPEDIRALPRGTALLLATGARAALIRLMPWYDGPDAATIHHAEADAERLITERASHDHR
jgi:type IV secretory pathway TraG/TraD family ATPase VirD4